MADGRDRANQPPSQGDQAKAYLADLAKKKGLEYGANYIANQYATPNAPSDGMGPTQPGSNNAGQVGAGAVGLLNAYDQYQKGNKTEAAATGAVGATNVAAGLQGAGSTAGQAAPYLGTALAVYNGAKLLGNKNLTDKQKATALRHTAEDTYGAIASLGISAGLQALDRKFAGGQGDKLRNKIDKYNPGAKITDKAGAKIMGAFNRGSSTHWEEKYRQELADKGVIIPNAGQKEWELNEKFKQSRNESDLTGRDIIHAGKFYDIPGYDKLSPDKQELIANEALKQGLIREHHGGIEVGMNEAYQKFIDTTLAGGGTAKPKQGNREPQHQQAAPKKKPQKKKPVASLDEINPYFDIPATQSPRYDLEAINYSSNYKNPYL
jgi:hypothetical protein